MNEVRKQQLEETRIRRITSDGREQSSLVQPTAAPWQQGKPEINIKFQNIFMHTLSVT
jgi:hypothetical protein